MCSYIFEEAHISHILIYGNFVMYAHSHRKYGIAPLAEVKNQG